VSSSQYNEITASQVGKEYKRKPSHKGVVRMQVNRIERMMWGIAACKRKASAAEKTPALKMTMLGKATSSMVINSKMVAEDIDALSIACQKG
jgi:hypothetical protein